MGKGKSGPEGPDQEHGRREIAPSDAAHEPDQSETEPIHVHDSKCRGSMVPDGADRLDAHLPEGAVAYDSGWVNVPGVDTAVRAVFVEGPPNEALRRWVRELMLRPAPSGPSAGQV